MTDNSGLNSAIGRTLAVFLGLYCENYDSVQGNLIQLLLQDTLVCSTFPVLFCFIFQIVLLTFNIIEYLINCKRFWGSSIPPYIV